MCGLAGFLDTRCATDRETAGATARAMAGTLRHRGPDHGGEWIDPRAGIALASRRLAILDLSPLGHQPMESRSGRYVIAYNGEIYNYKALRRQLTGTGESFVGDSDTEVLLAAVERWGLQGALERCNGMFALALWDRSSHRLSLARDRLGEKPLYYGRMGSIVLFGSELKALRAHPAFVGRIDRTALTLFMRHKYVPAPYSIFEDVRKLPQGTILTVDPGDLGQMGAPKPYWSARLICENGVSHPMTIDPEDAADELAALLADAVSIRMQSDVPLGAFLSGGVDSSTVVALMQARSTKPVKTFTVGVSESAYNEADHARAVAHHLHTEHCELLLTPQEVIGVIPRLPTIYDEPFSDSSQIPTFLISRFARQHVTVSLSGDGGDEVFGGYNRYVWVDRVIGRTRRLPVGLRSLAATGLMSLSPQRWDALMRWASPVVPWARQRSPGDKLHKLASVMRVDDAEAMYLGLVSHWRDPASLIVGGDVGPTTVTDRALWARVDDFTHQMMYLDLVTYLPDDILTKLDRASMGVSLEARVPLLDHRVVEFAWRLPLHMKISNGETKSLLRKVLYRHVPPDLIERPKSGFGVPIDSWLRGPLREWAASLLDERRLRDEGFIEPVRVRQAWAEHLSGRRNRQYHLWDVLMFQSWLESFQAFTNRPETQRVG